MLLVTLSSIAGIAAALSCSFSTSGGTVAKANCFSCPAEQCKIVTSFPISTVHKGEVSCRWSEGQNKGGEKRWYYNPTHKCFIWHNRLRKSQCRGLLNLDDCEVTATGPNAAAAATAATGSNAAAAATAIAAPAQAPGKQPPGKQPPGKQPPGKQPPGK